MAKLEKDNAKYAITLEEYTKIYKEETNWSMSLSANPFSFGGKNEYNAGKGYLTKALYFAYRDELIAIQAKDGLEEAKKALADLVEVYYVEYEEDRAFLSSK